MKTLFSVLLLTVTTVHAAPFYKWTGPDGVTGYGSVPPISANAAPFDATGAVSRDGESNRGVQEKPAVASTPTGSASMGSKIVAHDEKSAKENCQKAKATVELLLSGSRLATVDAAGDKTVMSDQLRAEELKTARQAEKDWCQK